MYDNFEEGLVDENTWGWVGSGILLHRNDYEVFLGMRSSNVSPPNLYSIPGGQTPIPMRGSIGTIRASAFEEFYEEVGIILDDSLYTGRFFVYPDMDLFVDINENENILEAYNAHGKYAQYIVFLYNTPDILTSIDTYEKIPGYNWENDYFVWIPMNEIPYENAIEGLQDEIETLLLDVIM